MTSFELHGDSHFQKTREFDSPEEGDYTGIKFKGEKA
jgi:hypothetical protein